MKYLSITAVRKPWLWVASHWIVLAVALGSPRAVHPQAPVSAPPVEAKGSALQQAQTLIDTEAFQQAAASLRAYLKTDANSAHAHAMLAYCLLRLDDPKDSLIEYTRSASLARPGSADLQNVAKDYALLNDLPDADHWMSLAVTMDPKDPEAWYGLGRIRFTQQRFQDAVDCFQRALALDPRSVKAEDNLGLSYEGLNRVDEATTAYRNAIQWQQTSPHPSEQPLLNLGIVLLHQGSWAEAEQCLTQAVAIAPNDVNIREQLGHVYLQTNELLKAQEQFERAVALNPKNPSLHFLLGRVYRAEGEDQKAKAEFAHSEALSGYHSTPENY